MSEFEKQPDASAPEQNATPAEPIAVPVPPKGGINGRLIAELAVLAVAVIALCVVGEVKKPEWWMLLRASLGSTGMQYTLGEYYANPDNPKQNLKKAEKWLKKAAERGNHKAGNHKKKSNQDYVKKNGFHALYAVQQGGEKRRLFSLLFKINMLYIQKLLRNESFSKSFCL